MKALVSVLLGVIVCLAALAAWVYTAPAAGSGWILLIAFLGTIGVLNSIRQSQLSVIAGLLVAGACGYAWYLHQSIPGSGWVLALALLAGLGVFQSLSLILSSNSAAADEDKN